MRLLTYQQPKGYTPTFNTAAYSDAWLTERLAILRREEQDGRDTPRRCAEIDTILEALQNRAQQKYRRTA